MIYPLLLVHILSCVYAGYSNSNNDFLVRYNLLTGQRHMRNLTVINYPTPVARIRLQLSTSTVQTENNNVIDICHIRLRWTDPDFWHDNFNEQNRKYHVVCIAFGVVTKNPKVKIHKKNKFINIYISGMFTGFDENFQLADTVKFVSCAIKAVNSHRLSSKWTKSKPIKIAR